MQGLKRFPDGFLWGAATSSHQVEGDNRNNDWWDWEQRPGTIRDGQRSGAAAQWWAGKAEEDLARAAELGMNAHRFGLEWSRLEPEPGRWDDAAFDRYREMLGRAGELGLTRMVTLNHFTLPRWAAARGSWCNPELPERFERLAAACAERLHDVVELWATLNEPNVIAFFGYAGTRWPPGLGRLPAFATALGNMLRAHALGCAALHRLGAASVGIVLNVPRFDPASPRLRDRIVTHAQDWAMGGGMLHALRTGWLTLPASLRPRRIDGLARSFDWLGLNYYGRFVVRFDPRAAGNLFGRHVQQPTTRTTWTDWGQPFPTGLTANLLRLHELGVPLYVTENGIFDNDDSERAAFIRAHVLAVHEAISRGVDVRGYFHWSLVDNFEWAEGWSTHFGLLALDRATGRRTARRSAGAYTEICRANGC